MRARRLLDSPIVTAASHPSLGENIQGPSLVRVPDWVPSRLGRYYLYFADHNGRYIRLAHADALLGPWRIHPPGALSIEHSHFPTEPPEIPAPSRARIEADIAAGKLPRHILDAIVTPHIASPDVHVDEESRRLRMYFHGLEAPALQLSRAAVSRDGLHFEARPEPIHGTYLRAFRHRGRVYALTMPGQLQRSEDGFTGWERGPLLFELDMRHAAVWKRGDLLHVFWTRVGDAPERILHSTVDLSGDWRGWRESDAVEVLRPERPWEGAGAPVVPSERGAVYGVVNQLRDPALFVEGDRAYLLYAVAGERGIAIAELEDGAA